MIGNELVFGLIYAIIEFFKYYAIYMGISAAKTEKKMRPYMISVIMSLLMVMVCVYLMGIRHISFFVLISGLLIPMFCFKDRKLKIAIVYGVISIAVYLVDSYILIISLIYIDGSIAKLLNDKDILLMNVLLTLPVSLLFLVIGMIRKKSYNYEEEFKEVLPQYVIMLVSAICCYYIVYRNQKVMYTAVSQFEIRLNFLFTTGSCILFFLLAIWQLRITSARNFYQKKDLFQQEYIEVQDNYFNEILNKEQQLRSFRHDIRSHIIAIQDMGERGDYSSLQEYTNHMLNQMQKLKRYNFSGNYVIDAVVSDIMQRAENENISVEWNGNLPPEMDIDRYDLCIVISNVMKNAVEACKKIDDIYSRYIVVNADTFENIFTLQVSNPINEPVKMENGRPVTSKENKSLHGYGTQNIEKIVKEYNGTVNYIVDDYIFSIEVLMHQKKTVEY